MGQPQEIPPGSGRMIVVMGFDQNEAGELRSAFNPIERPSEAAARALAASLANKHAGVIAWARSVNTELGEFGEPAIIYQHGQVPPDME